MLETSVSLLDRIAMQGHSDDWAELLTIYRPFIDQQVRKYPQLWSQADDIAQEIAIVLTRELPKFQRQRTGSFRAWLKQITLHQLQAAHRKLGRQPKCAQGSPSLEMQLAELADDNSLASKRWDDEHDRAVLKRVVEIVSADVNPKHWQAFQAHVLDGEGLSAVSQRLAVSENVVLLAKSRIKQRMRAEMRGLLE